MFAGVFLLSPFPQLRASACDGAPGNEPFHVLVGRLKNSHGSPWFFVSLPPVNCSPRTAASELGRGGRGERRCRRPGVRPTGSLLGVLAGAGRGAGQRSLQPSGMLIDTFIVRPLMLPSFILLSRRTLDRAAAFIGQETAPCFVTYSSDDCDRRNMGRLCVGSCPIVTGRFKTGH
jgi:hypothetical protein